jgi:putative membrane protein
MTRKPILLLIKGIAMGAADVVPGVSGGTIAFITGIYEELLSTIANINIGLLKTLKKEGVVSFWKAINGSFLMPLFAGIALSILSLAHAVTYAIDNYPLLVWGFFFGLIIASIIIIGKSISHWRLSAIVSLIIGAGIAFWITLLNPGQGSTQLWYIFLSGLLAICAMILPGISGAFILLLMGSYHLVLGAIKNFELITLVTFAAGCVTGLLSISKLLAWAFKNFNNLIISLLTGFLIGSLNKVWPWKQTISTRINSHGAEVPFIQSNVSPFNYQNLIGENQLIAVIGMALFGILLVLGLEYFGTKWSKK